MCMKDENNANTMHRKRHISYSEFEITLICTLLKIPPNRHLSFKGTVDILLHKPLFIECICLVFKSLLKEGSWNIRTKFDGSLDQNNTVLENFGSIAFQDIAGQYSQRHVYRLQNTNFIPNFYILKSCKVSKLLHLFYKSVCSRACTSQSCSALK